MKRKTLILSVVVVVLALAIATPLAAQTVWQTYGNVRVKQLNATGATDLDTTLNVDGAATLRGTTTIPSGGSLVVASGATLTTNGYVASNLTGLNVTGDALLGTATVTGTAAAADLSASDDLTVGDDMVIGDAVTIGGSGTITGSLTMVANGNVGGHLDVGDYFSVSGETYFISGDAWTVTDGSTITPTGTLMELTAAGSVGAQLAACGDGQLLTLINTANQTITISETTGFRSAGDFAMGQYDTLTIMGLGVTCYELARSNN